ncbi:hypothetical protein AVEN_56335-1 [Araneus ventricosus]|uniref:Uncharacterized protein n=1 Tax=Araneus ventricosus TaxID=182803 RepID=A0A4Y2VK17_ARAVE|nr:hypothetical protein AVEN_56335-1 [Araneus ventricosus]
MVLTVVVEDYVDSAQRNMRNAVSARRNLKVVPFLREGINPDSNFSLQQACHKFVMKRVQVCHKFVMTRVQVCHKFVMTRVQACSKLTIAPKSP